MGAYMYRITPTRVMCTDGQEANIAVFAYKPYYSIFEDKANKRMHFRSGATSSDKLAAEGRFTGRVVFGFKDKDGRYKANADSRVVKVAKDSGTFYDDYLKSEAYLPPDVRPIIEETK